MSGFLEFICCCFYPQKPISPSHRGLQTPKKKKKPEFVIKPSRIMTKYSRAEINKISKQNKTSDTYTCPICTLYFDRILTCTQCHNLMCLKCTYSYEFKFRKSTKDMRCPFCNSEKSFFIDYEGEPKKYYDSTGKPKKAVIKKDEDEKKIEEMLRNEEDKENQQIKLEIQKGGKENKQDLCSIPTGRNQEAVPRIPLIEKAPMNNHQSYFSFNRNSSKNESTVAEESSQANILVKVGSQNSSSPQQINQTQSVDDGFFDNFQLRTQEDRNEARNNLHLDE